MQLWTTSSFYLEVRTARNITPIICVSYVRNDGYWLLVDFNYTYICVVLLHLQYPVYLTLCPDGVLVPDLNEECKVKIAAQLELCIWSEAKIAKYDRTF